MEITIDGVSGTKTNTRTINAYPKYFGKGAKIYADAETDYYMGENHYIGADGWTNDTFHFGDAASQNGGSGYIVKQSGLFTFKSNNPDLFDVDGLGRIKPKAKGEGIVTVFYKGVNYVVQLLFVQLSQQKTVTPNSISRTDCNRKTRADSNQDSGKYSYANSETDCNTNT